jgi:DNA repair exonuclease SbcCD ATPase subunit
MEPIKFEGMNIEIAKDQPQYMTLPAYRDDDGVITTVWELDEEEKKKITEHSFICFQQHTFNQPMQPINLWVPGKNDVKKLCSNCEGKQEFKCKDIETKTEYIEKCSLCHDSGIDKPICPACKPTSQSKTVKEAKDHSCMMNRLINSLEKAYTEIESLEILCSDQLEMDKKIADLKSQLTGSAEELQALNMAYEAICEREESLRSQLAAAQHQINRLQNKIQEFSFQTGCTWCEQNNKIWNQVLADTPAKELTKEVE